MKSLSLLSAALAFQAILATGAPALTGPEAACRDAIAQAATRYAASAARAVLRCGQQRSAGTRALAVDCTDVAEAGNLGLAREAMRSAVVAACAGADSLLATYAGCPDPAASADDGGATAGIDDFGEVADCLAALADAHVGELAASAQGSPPQALLNPLRKCQGRLGKGSGRVMASVLGERRRCQAAADRAGGAAYSCDSADPRGRIAAAAARFPAKTAPRCDFAPEVIARLDACAGDRDSLLECAGSSAVSHGAALIRAAYGLDGPVTTTTMPPVTTTTLAPVTTTTLAGSACGDTSPQCNGTCPAGSSCVGSGASCTCVADGDGPCAPATIRRSILSTYSTVRDSVTALNAGWSGIARDIDVPDRAGDALDVSCDDHCENCSVSLHRDESGAVTGCRCTSDATKACNVVNGSDPDRCGSLDPTCRCYFGAPLPISSAGNPACVALRLRSDDGGTMNLRTGEWHDTMHLAAVVYLGIGTTQPCPNCEGDPVPQDGIKGGTCTGGIGNTPCDVDGVHSTFGPVSNDCLPASAANISGTGLLIDVNLTTSGVSLASSLPCDTPSGELCPCRTCTGNSLLSCSSDAQCAAAGAGTCTASGGAGVRKNQCTNFTCDATAECSEGPIDTYCDGQTYPDGRGYVPCSTNSDCTSGTCSIYQLRGCFPDPITYTGNPDRYGPTSVSAFCVAPTSNPAINLAAGLPGPGALLLTFDNDVRCKSDPDLPYEFPSGANCGGGGATTTTTLLPLPDCDSAAAPVCGGLCPTGQTCTASGGTCSCTGIPLPGCGDATAPTCAGICEGTGQLCTASGDTCQCMVVTLPQCTDAASPVCGGLCPTGELCQNVGNTCECGAPGVPTCGGAIAPACAGVCDVGQACVAGGSTCGCVQLPLPTCSETTPPLCVGTCALGSTCGQVGDACQCTPLPIP